MDGKETPGETPRDIARSVFETITEIDRRFEEFTREFDAGYSDQRKTLLLTIRRAERQGKEFTLANAKKELTKLSKYYYKRRRAKFQTLLLSVCKKRGRKVEHIVRVAGYNYRTKSIRTS